MRKYITVALGLLVLLGGYFIARAFVSDKGKSPQRKVEKTLPTVFVQTVQNTSIPITVKATGALMAKQRIELFSEVQGVFKQSDRQFKPGVYYSKGDILLQLEAADQYANLQAQKSSLYNLIATSLPDLQIDFPQSFEQWQQYASSFDVDASLPPLPAPLSDKEKVFISSKNIYTTFYNIQALELRLKKYTIKAPFSGTLTATNITSGTLVRPGQPLGEFISSNVYEMEVAVGVSYMPFMKVGKSVKVQSLTGNPKEWKGTVVRINPKVDRASQTATVYLQLTGEGLAEGLYLEAVIDARKEEQVFELSRSLLANEDQLFVVKNDRLALETVTLVHVNEKTVVVRGLNDGDKVLAKVIPGAYEDMEVKMYEED